MPTELPKVKKKLILMETKFSVTCATDVVGTKPMNHMPRKFGKLHLQETLLEEECRIFQKTSVINLKPHVLHCK
jgi:hypothetical protein